MKRFTLSLAVMVTPSLALGAAGTESHEGIPPAVREQMEATRARLMAWLDSVDKEAFRPGACLAKDELLLRGGAKLVGKILDYGPYVCFIDAARRQVLPREKVAKMTHSWGDPTPKKPDMPDLDVTYIERLPRYRGNHGNVGYDPKEKGVYLIKPNTDPLWPPRGTRATFKGHVVNKGPVEGKPFRYE